MHPRTIIDLATPIRSERVGVGRNRRTVFVYCCPTCQHETRMFASAFRGKTPEPGVGGVFCMHCTKEDA